MSRHQEAIRQQLSAGPVPARQLIDRIGLSQPTVSRGLAALGDEVVRLGAAQSIQYALRDRSRGFGDLPVYRVDADGLISHIGELVPVRPEGYVMFRQSGKALYSEGLPWWLMDMRPQGYLGRAYAARQGEVLGLPPDVNRWSDADALRALLAHGHDLVGNLLLGNLARARFTSADDPPLISQSSKARVYVALAADAAKGEVPGSSAGGKQPKFTAYAETEHGPRHVIVKFSDPVDSSLSERWRDLLLAEHLALQTLRAAGVPAAASWIHDHAGQRFLEVERFDRVGIRGRRALFSLLAVDAEFVGLGSGPWPAAARRLVDEKTIHPQAAAGASLLWAFGALIGNTDMHFGNLSFMTEGGGRPYDLAPCYDMSPMGFAPRSSGGMSDGLPEPVLHESVRPQEWRDALALAHRYCEALFAAEGFSPRFSPCIDTLMSHIELAAVRISRLGDR